MQEGSGGGGRNAAVIISVVAGLVVAAALLIPEGAEPPPAAPAPEVEAAAKAPAESPVAQAPVAAEPTPPPAVTPPPPELRPEDFDSLERIAAEAERMKYDGEIASSARFYAALAEGLKKEKAPGEKVTEALLRSGEMHRRAGLFEAAAAAYAEAATRLPSDSQEAFDAQIHHAEALAETGEIEDAIKALAKLSVRSKGERKASVQLRVAHLFVAKEDHTAAEELYASIAKLEARRDPKSNVILDAKLGVAHARCNTGRGESALPVYEEMQRWAKTHNTFRELEVHRARGHCLAQLERPDDAQAAFRQALEVGEAQNIEVRNELRILIGEMHVLAERFDVALAYMTPLARDYSLTPGNRKHLRRALIAIFTTQGKIEEGRIEVRALMGD